MGKARPSEDFLAISTSFLFVLPIIYRDAHDELTSIRQMIGGRQAMAED
jgi:hypothetical protein